MTSLQVGDYCFSKTKELELVGLNELERVVIGKRSFTQYLYNPNKDGMDPNRHFYLRNCQKVKELKIGCLSFMDYSICEIDNLPSLEVIEMGAMNIESYMFCYASLELKSDSQRMK